MKLAIEVTEPESSISLPNRAPSRKSGKNWAKNPAPLRMNVWVQCARIGSRETNAAMHRGDRREQKNAPALEGEPDQDAEADENPQ